MYRFVQRMARICSRSRMASHGVTRSMRIHGLSVKRQSGSLPASWRVWQIVRLRLTQIDECC